jgi:hypothetical protein
LAAEKNESKLLLFGLPKRATNAVSSDTPVTSITGPHANAPTKAPVVVDTDGMMLVRSVSRTEIPGLMEDAAMIFFLYEVKKLVYIFRLFCFLPSNK